MGAGEDLEEVVVVDFAPPAAVSVAAVIVPPPGTSAGAISGEVDTVPREDSLRGDSAPIWGVVLARGRIPFNLRLPPVG